MHRLKAINVKEVRFCVDEFRFAYWSSSRILGFRAESTLLLLRDISLPLANSFYSSRCEIGSSLTKFGTI
jgi:hypothetical protein